MGQEDFVLTDRERRHDGVESMLRPGGNCPKRAREQSQE